MLEWCQSPKTLGILYETHKLVTQLIQKLAYVHSKILGINPLLFKLVLAIIIGDILVSTQYTCVVSTVRVVFVGFMTKMHFDTL
jgi:hypothetical protein